MENKLLEIDLNESDEYDFDDFTQNLEYELFEHKIEFQLLLKLLHQIGEDKQDTQRQKIKVIL